MMPMEIINTCKHARLLPLGRLRLNILFIIENFFIHSAISVVTYAIVNVYFFDFVSFFFSNLISDVYQPLSQIRMSLAGSLGAAQVIFLGGINFTENTVRNFAWLVQSL